MLCCNRKELFLLAGDLLLQTGELLVQLEGLRIELCRSRTQRLRLKFENELAAFAAHQVPYRRRLPGEGGHDRTDVGSQLGRRDDAVAIEVGLAFQEYPFRRAAT